MLEPVQVQRRSSNGRFRADFVIRFKSRLPQIRYVNGDFFCDRGIREMRFTERAWRIFPGTRVIVMSL